MAFTDKIGNPVPTTKVFNRSQHDIVETFPYLGTVKAPAGKVSEIPAEVAELWCARNRWDPAVWKEVPITKDLPGTRDPVPTTVKK